MVLGSNYEDLYAEDGKKRLKSVKNHIMKANMVRRDMSERKLILDTKIIALKKRSKEWETCRAHSKLMSSSQAVKQWWS